MEPYTEFLQSYVNPLFYGKKRGRPSLDDLKCRCCTYKARTLKDLKIHAKSRHHYIAPYDMIKLKSSASDAVCSDDKENFVSLCRSNISSAMACSLRKPLLDLKQNFSAITIPRTHKNMTSSRRPDLNAVDFLDEKTSVGNLLMNRKETSSVYRNDRKTLPITNKSVIDPKYARPYVLLNKLPRSSEGIKKLIFSNLSEKTNASHQTQDICFANRKSRRRTMLTRRSVKSYIQDKILQVMSVPEASVAIYSCVLCGFKSLDLFSYKIHLKLHKEKVVGHYCGICGCFAPNLMFLEQHISSEHEFFETKESEQLAGQRKHQFLCGSALQSPDLVAQVPSLTNHSKLTVQEKMDIVWQCIQ